MTAGPDWSLLLIITGCLFVLGLAIGALCIRLLRRPRWRQ